MKRLRIMKLHQIRAHQFYPDELKVRLVGFERALNVTASNIIDRLDKRLLGMLPKSIASACSEINEQYSVAEYEEEKRIIQTAITSRQQEFIAGRTCARNALKSLGVESKPILRDQNGLPVWPKGSIGVISHSKVLCCAIAGKATDWRGLGLDLEMTNRLSGAAIRKVVHEQEETFVDDDQKRATLLFSAKEAFYKMQFPEWGTYANFHDLVFDCDEAGPDQGKLSIRSLSSVFPQDIHELRQSIEFRYAYFDEFVVTTCWLARNE